ncbi:hypothetical protein CFHF_06180 [Caulobacter flavus]|uniref:Uncharacterized protein n=1 Tax=Caulobacter flavus TaxID=1679497 RepID=A0A2N5CXB6_9CAUL|nr:hypothetical protein C1707_15185 [Caulobacter flavus]PLR18444.1 hypothetical protein CFHF_06180 [Caulobacter flavus]
MCLDRRRRSQPPRPARRYRRRRPEPRRPGQRNLGRWPFRAPRRRRPAPLARKHHHASGPE